MTSTMSSKPTEVRRLIGLLEEDLKSSALSNPQRKQTLEKLKIYGRDPQGADLIYSSPGIQTLSRYAFGDYSEEVSQEALRCIANALLLQPRLRDVLVELGHAGSTAQVYHKEGNDNEFLGARILFLLTYNTKADFSNLIKSHGLAESMSTHLKRHSSEQQLQASQTPNPMESMAMMETLKLLYNIASQYPSEAETFNVLVPSILSILLCTSTPVLPPDSTISTIINALAVLDFSVLSTETDAAKEIRLDDVVSQLVEILQSSVKKYPSAQLDTQAIPLLTVIRQFYEVSDKERRIKFQQLLLPADSERDLPLGRSSSLASALLRLSITPGLSNLPEAISAMMFEMSDKDASTFVKNIGYGYAAGYLMTHKISIPADVRQSGSGATEGGIPINPITGQRLDREEPVELPDMTQEEKEREAERLFVLFERLKATGVVDVRNPVEEMMMRQNRVEEVEDSD